MFCRLAAKIDLIDRHIAEHGLLRSDGEPQPALKQYISATNAARLALVRLETHVGNQRHDPGRLLTVYLETDDDA